jgi:hypothetical protein
VAAGFRRVLARNMPTPKACVFDAGQEFKGPFETMLRELNIVKKYKTGRNSMARLDAGIAQAKKTISRLLVRKGGKIDAALVAQAETSHNTSSHGALGGSTPDDAAKDDEAGKIVQFQLQKENAEAIQHNHAQNAQKTEALKNAGAFRQELPRTAFERGDQPKLGPKRTVATVERGQVTDAAGKVAGLHQVVVVPVGGAEDRAVDFKRRGLRDERLRTDLRPFALELHDALGNEEIALTAAARLMGDDFTAAKPSTLLFGQFLALYPRLFVVSGEGPAKTVRAVRRRIRGKRAG